MLHKYAYQFSNQQLAAHSAAAWRKRFMTTFAFVQQTQTTNQSITHMQDAHSQGVHRLHDADSYTIVVLSERPSDKPTMAKNLTSISAYSP